MTSWCPHCGEEQSPLDAGHLVICWSCDQPVIVVADHDDLLEAAAPAVA